MVIISGYVREGFYYSIKTLQDIFCFKNSADSEFIRFIKDLSARSIIQKKGKSEDADIVIDNFDDTELISPAHKYKFVFVGISICHNRIIFAFPKYIGHSSVEPPRSIPREDMVQIISVIEKYSREKYKQDIRNIDLFVDEEDKGKSNILSIMLFLLEDYATNGSYTIDDQIIDVNGSGDILWQKTIDEIEPIVYRKRPYYVEFYTKRNVGDETDFLKRLHECVVSKCSEEIEKAGLADFFSIPLSYVSEDEIHDFGDEEYIIETINRRLAETFDDRKISILKALLSYFKSNRILVGETVLQLIGTRSFHVIWEEVCAKVFSSQKMASVSKIEPLIDYKKINMRISDKKPPTLVELIPKPIWKEWGQGKKGIPATETFNPDYLKFDQKGHKEYAFYILDAKYYCPDWTDDKVRNQPGVEDIAKQYMYYLAYSDILDAYHVKEVKNYFLMPQRDGDNQQKGFVKLQMLKDLGLGVVEVRMLPPKKLYALYLKNETLSLAELH